MRFFFNFTSSFNQTSTTTFRFLLSKFSDSHFHHYDNTVFNAENSTENFYLTTVCYMLYKYIVYLVIKMFSASYI